MCVVWVSQGHGDTERGNVDLYGKSWKDQNCGHSWDALIQALSETALRDHHTK